MTVIHHHDPADNGRDEALEGDWYEYVFGPDSTATVGDWWWGEETDGTRVFWVIVPIPQDRAAHGSYGPLSPDGDGEIIRIYPSHEGPTEAHPSGNWAAPGPVNGWDGNEDFPTFRPSIFVGGTTDHPGWHGFVENGQLRNA